MISPPLRRLAAAFAVVILAGFASGAGQPPPQRPRKIEFTAAQQAALDRVSAYLNSIHTIKSGFIQLGPDGQLDRGEFLLEKPGQMRFEYFPPSPTLIVATGGKVYVKNSRLNTVDSYYLSDTPLGLLLTDNVDLKTNSAITGVSVRDDALVVQARSSNTRQQGDITLVFSNPQIELRQWTVKDNQGGTTMVALQDAVVGAPVDDSLFAVPLKAPRKSN